MSPAELRIPLPDLDCGACAERIALRLRRLEFVERASVSATEGMAHVRVSKTADLVRLVETIRVAGSEPAMIEISIPVASIATSLEQALSIERELQATEGVTRVAIDLAAGEVVAVLAPGRADADRIRHLLLDRGWEAAHPGPGAGSPPDRVQIDAARHTLVRALAVFGAALASTFLCARVGPRAVAPLFSLAGNLRERVAEWWTLAPGIAHLLLALLALAAVAAGGTPLLRGAFRDLIKGVATTRLLASLAVVILLVTSLASSLAGALFGASPPLFYASAIWSLVVVLTAATLGERALLARRRAFPPDEPGDSGEPERFLRLRARSAFSEGKAGRRGRREAAWWGAITLASAALAGAAWIAADRNRWPEAILAGASVLLVAAPGSFAMLASLGADRTIGELRRRGITVAGARALELAARIEVLFATLRGAVAHPDLRVSNFVLLEGINPAELLSAAVEGGSASDPRIRAIGERLGRERRPATAAGGRATLVGSSEQLRQQGVDLTAIDAEIADLERALKTVVVVARERRPLGAIALESELRPQASEAVERLRALGCQVWIATEDTDETGAASASAIGASRYASGLDHEGKARLVAQTRDEGLKTAFVGGPRDALAARRADLAISFRDSGPEETFEDALILRTDAAAVAELVELARESERRIRRGRGMLYAYHLIGIPLAAGALGPWIGYAPAPFLAVLASGIVVTVVQSWRTR